MSSPIYRSSDPHDLSYYAPKRARNLNTSSLDSMANGHDFASNGPANTKNLETELLQFRGSLEPTLVPEPPMAEQWRRHTARSFEPIGDITGSFFRFLLIAFLAALIALVIVAVWPTSQNFVAKQHPSAKSAGAPLDSDASGSPVGPGTTANRLRQAGAARSDSRPSRANQPIVGFNTAATAPAARPSPDKATQPAVGTWTRETAKSVNLALAKSAPVAAAPPAGNPTLSVWSAPPSSLKSVPIQPKMAVRYLDRDDIEILLKQGDDFVSFGDFASARLVFGRVAAAGDARGALALAATYDPIVLSRIGAKGAVPDAVNAREWYVKARDLGSPDAALRLDALASRSVAAVASRDDSTVPTHQGAVMASVGNESLNKTMSQNSAPSEAPVPNGSYWKSADSIMRLEARGSNRKFFFYKPSNAELKAGAKAGSLRFDGKISGKGYKGTAFLYSEKCGRSVFQVSGEIENDDSRVILSGRAPNVDSDCRKFGRTDQTLIFDFMDKPPT
jgi:TPR repeat protein